MFFKDPFSVWDSSIYYFFYKTLFILRHIPIRLHCLFYKKARFSRNTYLLLEVKYFDIGIGTHYTKVPTHSALAPAKLRAIEIKILLIIEREKTNTFIAGSIHEIGDYIMITQRQTVIESFPRATSGYNFGHFLMSYMFIRPNSNCIQWLSLLIDMCKKLF